MKILRGAGFFFGTLVIYLGVPLLGWGIDDLGGFFFARQRLGYAAVIAIFSLAVGYQGVAGPEGIRSGRGEGGKLVRRQSLVRVVVILLMYSAFLFLPSADRHSLWVMAENPVLQLAGLLPLGLGCALIFWSGVALGRMYSAEVTIQTQHQLITTGLYRYIRHPRYLGIIVYATGLSLVFRSWIGLAAIIPLLTILLFRIKDEEALMSKEFGQAWDTYCKRSWRLLPLVY